MKKGLIYEIENCQACKKFLPFDPTPVFSISPQAKILIVGQAPGLKVQKSRIPWDDPSGRRLRSWMKVSREQFYDPKLFSIAPMGLCYPGKGQHGDLPPRPECAPLWMNRMVDYVKPELILLIGNYAQRYFLKESTGENLTETVLKWKTYLPKYFVLPHPSPRNNFWLRKNPWFEENVVPALEKRVHQVFRSRNKSS